MNLAFQHINNSLKLLRLLLQIRGQFHQHSMPSFYVRKLCAELFVLTFQVCTLLAQDCWRKSCTQNVGEIDPWSFLEQPTAGVGLYGIYHFHRQVDFKRILKFNLFQTKSMTLYKVHSCWAVEFILYFIKRLAEKIDLCSTNFLSPYN